MTTLLPIGVSTYGDLVGVMQYLEASAAAQLIGLRNAVHARLGWTTPTTPRITFNEGDRSATRCYLLYSQYEARRFAPPVVAKPLTSNHYPARAVDLGIVTPDGRNVAFESYADARAAWKAECQAYGWFWTGESFGETWHYEYGHVTPTKVVPRTVTDDHPLGSGGTPAVTPPPILMTQGDSEEMFAAVVVADSTNPAHGKIAVGTKFILDMREKTLARVDIRPDLTPAKAQTLSDEFNTLAAVQPGAKPISWTGDDAWKYIDGGYKAVGF